MDHLKDLVLSLELTKEAKEGTGQQSSSGDAANVAKAMEELRAKLKTAEDELADLKEEQKGLLTAYNGVQQQQEQAAEMHKVWQYP